MVATIYTEPSTPTSVSYVKESAISSPSLSMTLKVTYDIGSDSNSDIQVMVTPTCRSPHEPQQTSTCSQDSTCSVTGLQIAGCAYTFEVRLKCSDTTTGNALGDKFGPKVTGCSSNLKCCVVCCSFSFCFVAASCFT